MSHTIHSILFADDSNLLISGPSLDFLMYQMNKELSKVVDWFRANKLSLNINKTNYMIFHAKNKKTSGCDHPICINNEPLNLVQKTKFLGVIIDSQLTWRYHIAHVANKISKSIGIISKAKKYVTKSILRNLYYTFIYPYISYCNSVWALASHSLLNMIHILQKKNNSYNMWYRHGCSQ